MKPQQGSFAANILTWGCGGMNIDASRVGTDGGTSRSHQAEYARKPDGTEDRSQCWARTGHQVVPIDKGRWPANVILDEEAADLLDQQGPVSQVPAIRPEEGGQQRREREDDETVQLPATRRRGV